MTVDEQSKSAGDLAYTAYRDFAGGVSLATGTPIPEWSGLRENIRQAWEASARVTSDDAYERGFYDGTIAERNKW